MKTKSIKSNFINSRGFTLDARIDISAGSDIEEIKTFVIFCHCFTCTKETITTFRLSRLLAEHGYGVLRFDFTGLGNSEGEFAATTFSTTQDDLRSAISFLKENFQPPSFLMGHSLGGTTALSIAKDYDCVKGVVTVASPSEPEHVLHHFGHALTLLEQGISASFEVAGQFYDIEPAFVEDVRNFDMQPYLHNLEKPALIFNIENDSLVNQSNAIEIQQWLKDEATLVNISGSDHLLSNKEASEMVAGVIVKWIEDLE
jgi:esterase/lipase